MAGKKTEKVRARVNKYAYKSDEQLVQETMTGELEMLKPTDRLRLVVALDNAADVVAGFVNRIRDNSRKKVIERDFTTFKSLSAATFTFPEDTELYLVGHGNIHKIGGLVAEELVGDLLPFLQNNPQIKTIKLASCYSGAKIDTSMDLSIEQLTLVESKNLDVSLAEQISNALSKCGAHVYGYIGQHGEEKKKKETHSFISLKGKEYRASTARVHFFQGIQQGRPQESLKAKMDEIEIQDAGKFQLTF